MEWTKEQLEHWRDYVPEGCECRFEYFRPPAVMNGPVRMHKNGTLSWSYVKKTGDSLPLRYCPPGHKWSLGRPSQYGGRTTCMIWRTVDNQPLAYGESTCSWLDTWSYEEGRKYAAKDALEHLWRNFPRLVPVTEPPVEVVDIVDHSGNVVYTDTAWAMGAVD